MNHAAKYIIITGILVILVGIILFFFPNAFKWFGRLPGDIRIEKENFRFYFPIVTMILISVIATVLFNVIRKLF